MGWRAVAAIVAAITTSVAAGGPEPAAFNYSYVLSTSLLFYEVRVVRSEYEKLLSHDPAPTS